MNMYNRIKNMTKDELREFIYWVYLNGNEDAQSGLCDSAGECSFFGGHMLNIDVDAIMPNNSINDLWDTFKQVHEKR